MRIFKSVATTALLLTSACIYTSPPLRTDPNAISPYGVHGVVSVGLNYYSGELLAITKTDFTLLSAARVLVIPFAIARTGDFDAIGVGTFGAPSANHAEQLRFGSRYPYGIPAPALDAILRANHQTAPDTVKLQP